VRGQSFHGTGTRAPVFPGTVPLRNLGGSILQQVW